MNVLQLEVMSVAEITGGGTAGAFLISLTFSVPLRPALHTLRLVCLPEHTAVKEKAKVPSWQHFFF